MSGATHQTHDVPVGDECLAADFFAPDLDDCDRLCRSPSDPAPDAPPDEEFAAPTPPIAPPTAFDGGGASLEALELEADSGPGDRDTELEPAYEPLPEPDGDDEAFPLSPEPVAAPRLPRVTDHEFLLGGACALPDLRVTPPPLALDPDARPVPDALPERRPRRKRLRAWACACLAIVAGEIAAGYWNAPPPEILVREVAAASGIHPDDFLRIAEIESRLDPKAYNRLSKASGLFQLLPGTAKQYNVADSFDPKANAEAAARLLKHNAGRLKKALGREPTAWELYLAHQQGATGAIKLLKNPDKKAIDVVGRLPVLWNRGTEEMTAKQFAAMWREAFNGKKKATAVN